MNLKKVGSSDSRKKAMLGSISPSAMHLANSHRAKAIKMTAKNAGPTFYAHKMKLGSAWYVLVVWHGQYGERIKGFLSEAAAEDWIARESIEWLEKRKGKMAKGRK
jgi:hypothetical protein